MQDAIDISPLTELQNEDPGIYQSYQEPNTKYRGYKDMKMRSV